MPSRLPGFEYDIFISYRQNDNRSGWVTDFVRALEEELAATFMEPVSIYFDKDLQHGLLETHDVDKSLEGKLKCLVFVPIISQTYSDPKSYAWQHELCAFNRQAREDGLGQSVKLASGNVAGRILPIRIHDLDAVDKSRIESEIGPLRGIEFIFRSPGVNRPLSPADRREENSTRVFYRDQINKVANALKEILIAIPQQGQNTPSASKSVSPVHDVDKGTRKKLSRAAVAVIGLFLAAFIYFYWFMPRAEAGVTDKSIAVLPFKLIGNDQEGKYFAEGVADALINHLHEIKDVRVRSRTSVEKYAGSPKNASEIGNELNVGYILEGSAQKYKDDIRIIVQLINTRSDEHVWYKEYNEKFEDIFRIQSEIALNIASELNVKLAGPQKQRVQKIPTKSPEAYDLFLRGMEYHKVYWKHDSQGDREIAANFYRKAIAIDPEFALAYTNLQDVSPPGFPPDSSLILLSKAIALDPQLPDAYEHLGLYYLYVTLNYPKAIEAIGQALAIDSAQNFLLSLGRVYSAKNDHLEALRCFQLAFRKERTPFYQWVLYETGVSYLGIGDISLAKTFADGALTLEPDNLNFLRLQRQTQMIAGDYDGMIHTTNEIISVENNKSELADLGWTYIIKGDNVESARVFKSYFDAGYKPYVFQQLAYACLLRKQGQEANALKNARQAKEAALAGPRISKYFIGAVYAFLDEKEKAVLTLEEWSPSFGFQFFMDKDPMFEKLYSTPDFQQLVKKLQDDAATKRAEAKLLRERGTIPSGVSR